MNQDKFTLTETIQQMDCWIQDVQFDLTQDWNEDKVLMQIQLQQLIIAKANLETILKTGGQILHSSIKKI
jgi:ATP-dependent protease HslVU (ClpYQ) peptidase subunit